jgi:hypothetical protein
MIILIFAIIVSLKTKAIIDYVVIVNYTIIITPLIIVKFVDFFVRFIVKNV